jgi:hypothetical protein
MLRVGAVQGEAKAVFKLPAAEAMAVAPMARRDGRTLAFSMHHWSTAEARPYGARVEATAVERWCQAYLVARPNLNVCDVPWVWVVVLV